MKARLLFCGIAAVLLCGACGDANNTNCPLIAVHVSPANATADHTAVPPGNQQQFFAFGSVGPGCVSIQSNRTDAVWSTSDPANVSISNAKGATYGVATCLHSTAGPVTITATLPTGSGTQTVSGTAMLSCN